MKEIINLMDEIHSAVEKTWSLKIKRKKSWTIYGKS